MATIKSYTDIPQSKVLDDILPHDSADMWFVNGIVIARDSINEPEDIKSVFPCWSLAALLNVLPILERKGYQKTKPRLLYNVTINKWIVDSHVYTTDAYDNPVDACVAMIEKLHELKKL